MKDKGAFIIARKAFDSDLWRFRPSTWWKIWCYILGHVQHEDYKELKRGQGYFNFKHLVRSEVFGKDDNKAPVTYSSVDHFLRYATAANMLAKRQATWGTLITVCKYDQYQTLNNYKSELSSELSSEGKSEPSANHRRTIGEDINKNDKNEKNGKEETTEKIPPYKEGLSEKDKQDLWDFVEKRPL